MIDLQIIVDLITANTNLTDVYSSEAKIGIPTMTQSEVIIGRAKHDGEEVGTQSSVCNQKIISRFAVQTIALEADLFVIRNKSFNALIGKHLDYYGAELLFEDGAIEDVNGGFAAWTDVYRVEWSWDERGGTNGTGGPWGVS